MIEGFQSLTASPVTANEAMVQAKAVLVANGRSDADQVAKLLLLQALNVDSSGLISLGTAPLSVEVQKNYVALLERAIDEPVYRIIGVREFHGLELALHPDTLEPRDDTEALIELVLQCVSSRRDGNLQFADLGTGTGAVAFALLSELPNANAVITDIAAGALETASATAQKLGFGDRVSTRLGSWTDPLCRQFDFIVSNPPYIASSVIAGLSPMVREHDPMLALDGGEDGLDAYRDILANSSSRLKADGFLALEIGYDQKTSVIELALSLGWNLIGAHRDLGGNDRALAFSR